MNIQIIEKIFRRLSDISPEETIGLRFLCEAAVDYISCRLRNKEECVCGDRLEFAAAALAYYRYVLWEMTDGGMNEIKVGEISARRGGTAAVDAAEKLCREAFDNIRDLLEPEGFVFTSVG